MLPTTQQNYSGWEYRRSNRTVVYPTYRGGAKYEVDLDRCTTPEEIEDWINHISKKNWAYEQMLQGLRKILKDYA